MIFDSSVQSLKTSHCRLLDLSDGHQAFTDSLQLFICFFFFDNYLMFTAVKEPPAVTRRHKWICAYNPRARNAGQEYSWGLLDRQPNLLGELQASNRYGVRKPR